MAAILAKRLAEPHGIWGFFAYMVHSDTREHFDLMLDTFQAMGAMCLREEIHSPTRKPDEYSRDWDVELRKAYYRQVKARNIDILAIIEVRDYPQISGSISTNKFVPPEYLTPFLNDVEAIGLLKMDFLGLRTLTLVHDCLESISQAEDCPRKTTCSRKIRRAKRRRPVRGKRKMSTARPSTAGQCEFSSS